MDDPVKRVQLAIQHSRRLEQRLAEAREVLKDFSEHGTRHDTRPTMPTMDPVTQANILSRMLRSSDNYVRDTARKALE